MEPSKLVDQLIELIFNYGPKMIGAILVLIIGSWVIKLITKMLSRALDKSQIDPTLKPFLKGLGNTIMKVLLGISILGMVGIEMTSFIAVLGAAGLAVGMALSGTLQNFAGGTILLILKPYKVGDFIETQGYMGTVSEVQLFTTVLKTGDNKTIVIPNGGLSNSSLINYSTEPKRRVDWTFGIAYGDSTEKAKEVIKALADADERIHKDPEVFMAISALADSSVNIVVRAWVNSADYWGVFFSMNEKVYNTFGKEGLNIPFPQMDVHLHQKK